MQKKILVFSLILISFSVKSQNFYLPDDNFEQALINLGYDIGPLDDSIPIANINTITYLDIAGKNITDATGFKYFIALEELYCQNNQITSINLFYNTALTTLNLSANQLQTLNLSTNTALTHLDCNFTALTSLDLTNNITLVDLQAGYSNIVTLNIEQCTALEDLFLVGNSISTLNLTNNPVLKSAILTGNLLDDLDITQNTALSLLEASALDITTLDLSQNLALDTLIVSSCSLDTINLSQNTALTYLSIESNNIEQLDLSQNTNLVTLICGFNDITALNLSGLQNLEKLDCRHTLLNTLDIKNSNNSSITFFKITDNPDLTCVTVDNTTWSSLNWTNIDAQTYFSENCGLGTKEGTSVDYTIYPNPTHSKIHITINESINYILTSLNGQQIDSGQLLPGTNQIDLEELDAGTYLISFESENVKQIQKIIRH